MKSAITTKPLILAIRAYQKTRYLRQPSCRFYPSCSEYMIGSLARHGLIKGLFFGLRRLSCCHPWHPGGVDKVV